jgi:hypothetical protein
MNNVLSYAPKEVPAILLLSNILMNTESLFLLPSALKLRQCLHVSMRWKLEAGTACVGCCYIYPLRLRYK